MHKLKKKWEDCAVIAAHLGADKKEIYAKLYKWIVDNGLVDLARNNDPETMKKIINCPLWDRKFKIPDTF